MIRTNLEREFPDEYNLESEDSFFQTKIDHIHFILEMIYKISRMLKGMIKMKKMIILN